MRKRDVYYWQERSILKDFEEEWKEHLVFKIIDEEGNIGIGASTPNKEFGETFKTSMAIVESLRKVTENFDDLNNIVEFENTINSIIKKDMAAKTTVLLAVYDYISNKNNVNIEKYYFDLKNTHKKQYIERIIINKNFKFFEPEDITLKLDIKKYLDVEQLIKIINLYNNYKIIIDFSGLYNLFELNYIMKNINNSNIIALEQPLKYGQEFQISKFINKGYKIYWDESFNNLIDYNRIKNYSDGFVFTLSKLESLYNISNLFKYIKNEGYETIISSEIEHPINLEWSKRISSAFDVIDLNFLKYIIKTNK